MRNRANTREAQAALGLMLALLLLAAVSVWDAREDRQDRAPHGGSASTPAPAASSPLPREAPR